MVVIHLPRYLFCDILSQGVLKARKNTESKISGAAAADGRPTAWTVKVCPKNNYLRKCQISGNVLVLLYDV